MEEGTHHIKENPLTKASFFSELTFGWLSNVMKIGYKRDIEVDDLYNVTYDDSSEKLCKDLDKRWQEEYRNKKNKASLVKSVLRTHWVSILRYSLLGCFEQACRLSLPLQLAYMMRYIGGDDAGVSRTNAYVTAFTIGTAVLCVGLVHHLYIFGMQRVGMRIRIALCSMIYRKSLKMSRQSICKANAGRVVNLMSNDVSRFDMAFKTIAFLYIAPIELVVIFYILQMYFGLAVIPGYIFMLLIISGQTISGKGFSSLRAKIASLTDRRVHLMSEVLAGMRVIKVYCWEPYFANTLLKIRSTECSRIFVAAYLKALVVSGPYFSMVKISIGLIVVCHTLILGEHLTPTSVFILIGYYNVLRLDVGWLLPYSFQQLSEIAVSLSRIKDFLLLEEWEPILNSKHESFEEDDLDSDQESKETSDDKTQLVIKSKNKRYKNTPAPKTYGAMLSRTTSFTSPIDDVITGEAGDYAIQVNHASTLWNNKDMKGTVPVLDDINFKIKTGELVAVIGPVGAGKTSLLMALLGELPVVGDIRVAGVGGMAYASQEPWVFSSSLRQNVLFGRRMDARLFRKTIDAVSLKKDLELMPNGDSTLVGERGMSLSGGQRARVGLARAVYSGAEIILMDDPLSAVDANVGRHLFERCIKGELAGKTRILVTHQLQFIKQVDKIISIKEGKVLVYNSYESLLKGDDTTNEFLTEKEEKKDNDLITDELIITSIEQHYSGSTMHTSASLGDYNFDITKSYEASVETKKKIVLEDLTSGGVGFSAYKTYVSYGVGVFTFILCILLSLALNVSNVFNDWLLARWSDKQLIYDKWVNGQFASNNSTELRDYYTNFTMNSSTTTVPESLDLKLYLTIYGANIGVISVLAGINSVLIYFLSINSSKNLHNHMLKSLLKAPVSFFDTNPVGRILNRFSKDTGQLDEIMPTLFYEFTKCIFAVISILAITALPNPLLMLGIIPLIVPIVYIRKYYLRTSRQVKRIEGATRSPVFTHASASMLGLSTVRAFSVQRIFQQEFDLHQDQHTEAWFIFMASSRWMSLRIDMLCALFVYAVGFLCVTYARVLTSGVVGLTLTYSFSLVNLFSWVIFQNIEVENMMTSVERIMDYVKVKPEAENETRPGVKDKHWPSSGKLRSREVSLRYSNCGALALNKINFDIKDKEKIGIVGRTGAGKSSLITMLFRLTEHQGQLLFDDVDISALGLHDLRSNISIIPQDPVLFVGCLRENLDPFGLYSDSQIWTALREVRVLESLNVDSSGGLSSPVAEGGSNFSVGQRQLLCLARALLNRNRLLIIDEATANVDTKTDELIQKTIKERFSDCTILTIAHRIHTIMDSHRIMVMEKGEIVEFESPVKLLEKKGLFYELVKNIDNINIPDDKKNA